MVPTASLVLDILSCFSSGYLLCHGGLLKLGVQDT